MHNLIFRSRGRSYRELPLRLFEFGSVYRYEKSGVVHGLTRVRGMTQDDSHSYVTRSRRPARSSTCSTSCSGCSGLRPRRLLPRAVDPRRLQARQVRRLRRGVGGRRPRCWRRSAASPASSWCPTRVARPTTARRSRCRPRRHRPDLADVDHPVRLQPAARLRAGVPGRRRHPAAAGDDPLGEVRVDRAVHRRARRALRRRVPALAGPGPGAGDPGRRAAQRLPRRRRGTAAGRRACASRSTTPTTGCRRRSATRSCRRCRS